MLLRMSTCKPLIAKPLKSSLEIKLIPPIFSTYAMSCVIWYRLYNLKIGNNTNWVLPLVKLQAKACNFTTKITFLHGCSSRFLNCTNGNKWRNASHMIYLHQTLGGVRLRLLKSFCFFCFLLDIVKVILPKYQQLELNSLCSAMISNFSLVV